ncbi:hypothetical protein Tco_1488225 [Tanacetum coccineum]
MAPSTRPDPLLTRPDPDVDRWSTAIDRWSSSGLTVVRHRWPPLTATINHHWLVAPVTSSRTADWPHGTTQVVTRGVLIIMQVRFGTRKLVLDELEVRSRLGIGSVVGLDC